MKSVLLVSANQEKIPYPVAPLGLLYIARALKHNGIKVSILDLCFSKNISRDIKVAINSFKPDFVGVSIRNVDNLTFPASVSYLSEVKNVVKYVKTNTKASIILGGSAFSLFPEGLLRLTGCSMGIVGEGEEAFVKLIKSINFNSGNLNIVQNLAWIRENKFHQNRIDCLKSKDYVLGRELINNSLYSKFGGMGNVQTKRGCKFRCAYCTYPYLEGNYYRLRSPAIIAQEIKILKTKYKINHIFFVDSVFNYPVDHAAAICEEILKKKIGITWSCFAWPHRTSSRLLELMKKSGCTHIEFGSDAFSEKVLTMLHKPFTVDDIMSISERCKKTGIKFCHYVIFGAPGENRQTLEEAFRNLRQIKSTAIIAMAGIRIYPNTELHKISVKDNIVTPEDDLLEPRFYLSPKISQRILLNRVAGFARSMPNCVAPGLDIRSSSRMFETLRKHYPQGPLWGYLGG
jgi:radical SAM superfamily enzyme YgiQ (UPF0313 family)